MKEKTKELLAYLPLGLPFVVLGVLFNYYWFYIVLPCILLQYFCFGWVKCKKHYKIK